MIAIIALPIEQGVMITETHVPPPTRPVPKANAKKVMLL